jgi:hypothetical protein
VRTSYKVVSERGDVRPLFSLGMVPSRSRPRKSTETTPRMTFGESSWGGALQPAGRGPLALARHAHRSYDMSTVKRMRIDG